MNKAPGGLHIAVFARAPVPGAAKTRLIPLLGAHGAAFAQRQMTLRTLALAASAAPGQVSLWTAGDAAHPFFEECASRFGVVLEAQAGGDLGERMAACMRALLRSHGQVLLIGTDCPAFAGADLLAAHDALLVGSDMVFTPAEDGGYVLVGARAMPPDRQRAAFAEAFSDIEWSTDRVMEQTRARLAAIGWRRGGDWSELPALWDVDTPKDYLRAQREGLIVQDEVDRRGPC